MSTKKNPFLKSNIGAKIPDGKATLSNPVRVQSVYEYVVTGLQDTTGVQSGQCIICLMPSINNVASIFTGGAEPVKALPLTNHVPMTPGSSTSQYSQPAGNMVQKWRIVSHALKISLINNAEENDGWWEAIRINPDVKDGSYVSGSVGPFYGILGGVNATSLPFVPDLLENWTQHPTYISGRLREIHTVMFKLNSTSTDHDFLPLKNDGAISDLLDPAYDCILIRINGRITSESDNSKTRLLFHGVSNQELIYKDNAVLQQYATPCYPVNNAVLNAERYDRTSPITYA